MSMPLAIIGNEYENAWEELQAEKEASEAQLESEKDDSGEGGSGVVNMPPNRRRSNHTSDRRKHSNISHESDGSVDPEMPKVSPTFSSANSTAAVAAAPVKRITPSPSPVLSDDSDAEPPGIEPAPQGLMGALNRLRNISSGMAAEVEANERVTPALLMSVCDMRAWITTLQFLVQTYVADALAYNQLHEQRDKEKVKTVKKTSVIFRRGSVAVTSKQTEEQRQKALDALVAGNTGAAPPSGGFMSSPHKVAPMDIEAGNSAANASAATSSPSVTRPVAATGHLPHLKESLSVRGDRSGSDPTAVSKLKRGIATIFKQELRNAASADGKRNAGSLLMMLARVSQDISDGGNHSVDFEKKMARAAYDPTSWRSRLWMLLELPNSSREAKGLRGVLMFLIFLSVFTLYTQTLTTMSKYGEHTVICSKVVDIYCGNKNDPLLDPGCFVQNPGHEFAPQKLQFNCDHDDCFGVGRNFGSSTSPFACFIQNHTYQVTAFQSQQSLSHRYGVPTIANTRDDSHKLYAVCDRVECGSPTNGNGNAFWIPLEVVINTVFTIELALRIAVAESYRDFLLDFMNIFDFLSVIPFYVEISSSSGGAVDFAVLASSPEPLILVFLKSFKVRFNVALYLFFFGILIFFLQLQSDLSSIQNSPPLQGNQSSCGDSKESVDSDIGYAYADGFHRDCVCHSAIRSGTGQQLLRWRLQLQCAC